MPLTSSNYYSLNESVNQFESFCGRTQYGYIVDMTVYERGVKRAERMLQWREEKMIGGSQILSSILKYFITEFLINFY